MADEFRVLVSRTSVPTPAMDRLYAYLDPETPLMPEGSAEIPLDWRGVWLAAGALVGLVGLGAFVWKSRKE